MNLIIVQLHIPIEKDGVTEYLRAASQKLDLAEGHLAVTAILSKSLDMSCKEQFYYKLAIVVRVPKSFANKENFPQYTEQIQTERKSASIKDRPLIVGFGPAGMFAALELIDYGLKPLIFERGKKIEERSVDVQRFIRERQIDPESNIQFGEGGAGSYSDGKLFSRRNNNTGAVSRVLKTFVKFGAPEEIGYISKPHLGTDVLCKIVRNIRIYILERGGEIYFGAKMTDILISEGKASGIIINGEKEYLSSMYFYRLGPFSPGYR